MDSVVKLLQKDLKELEKGQIKTQARHTMKFLQGLNIS